MKPVIRFNRHSSRRARGFTLVELVVVVGIIVTLLSLVLAVSTLLIQQNESRQLESAFANLSSAVQEYELAVGRPITFQDRSDPAGVYDIQKDPEFRGDPALPGPYAQSGLFGMLCPGCDEASEPLDRQGWCKFNVKLFSLLARTQSAEEIVARLDPAMLVPLRKSNGDWTGSEEGEDALQALVDPWGTPVAVVMPGRRWREGLDSGVPDSDGTIRTFFENKAGVCRNGKPLFVSAGPDGDLGCRTCDGLRGEAAVDNVYSYDPEA